MWSIRWAQDVTRFHMLTRKNDAPLDFDFDKVLEQSKDNPVFYVQYANARVNSACCARHARPGLPWRSLRWPRRLILPA